MIDVPSGRVVARVRMRGGAVESVAFRNVPSFVIARGVAAAGVEVDVAYGGAIYASVPASAFGLRVVPEDLPRLIDAGRAVKAALADHEAARHPTDDRLSGIYGTILWDELGPRCTSATSRCSPTARSTARPAARARRRASRCSGLAEGETLRHDSIVGTTFIGRIVGETGEGVHHGDRGHRVQDGRAPLHARPARPPRHRLRAAVSRERR